MSGCKRHADGVNSWLLQIFMAFFLAFLRNVAASNNALSVENNTNPGEGAAAQDTLVTHWEWCYLTPRLRRRRRLRSRGRGQEGDRNQGGEGGLGVRKGGNLMLLNHASTLMTPGRGKSLIRMTFQGGREEEIAPDKKVEEMGGGGFEKEWMFPCPPPG